MLLKTALVLNLNSSSLETYVFIDLVITKTSPGTSEASLSDRQSQSIAKRKSCQGTVEKITSSVVEQYLAKKYNLDAGVVAVEKFVHGKNLLILYIPHLTLS